MKKLLRAWKKQLIKILIGLFAILVVIGILFFVQKIEVSGNDYIKETEIIESIEKDPLSVNALYDVLKYRYMKPKLPGGIAKMKVSMKNPWTLKVTVTERQIIGYFEYEKDHVFFDKDGIVVLKDNKKKTDGIPCIEGMNISSAKLYGKIKMDNDKLLKAVLSLAKEVKSFELTPDRIVCTDDGIEMYFGDICVMLGMDISTEKIAQIKPILAKLEGQAGVLHLEHYNSDTKTITFKKAVVEEEEPEVEEEIDVSGEDYSEDEYYEEDYDDEYYDDEYYDDYYEDDYSDDEYYDDGYYEEEEYY